MQCANCRAELPAVRRPDSLRQAMWGGWTCASCGSSLDARGRPLDERTDGPHGIVWRFGAPPSGAVGLALTAAVPATIAAFALGGCGVLALAVVAPPLLLVLPIGLLGFLVALGVLTVLAVVLSRRGELVILEAHRAVVGDRSVPWASVHRVERAAGRLVLHTADGDVALPGASPAFLADLERCLAEHGRAQAAGSPVPPGDESRLAGLAEGAGRG